MAPSDPSSGQIDIESLLRLSVRIARAGNTSGARALLRAVARERPDDPRAWRGLAHLAESDEERRVALTRLVDLDPEDDEARETLGQLAPSPWAPPYAGADGGPHTDEHTNAPVTGAQETVAPASRSAATEPVVRPAPQRTGFPLWLGLVLVAVAALILVVPIFLTGALGGLFESEAAQPTPPAEQPTPPLPTLAASRGEPSPGAPASPPATPTATTAPPAAGPGTLTTATPALPVASSPPPAQTARPAPLPMGAVQEYDGWQAILLLPQYAVALDGSIGDLRPNGRFVLAVLSVANTSPTPRVMSPDLLTLTDSQGRRFAPVPGASRVYLELFGRAQRGDFALEEEVPGGGGMYSIPVIFDVPPDASGLLLTMGPAAGGWPVAGPAGPGFPAGPNAAP